MAQVIKNPPADAGGTGDMDLIPGSGRSPGGGNGNPLQYSCLENPTDSGTWGDYSPWGSKESDTPEQLSTQSETPTLRVWPPLISAQVSRPPPHTHPW